MSEVGKALLGPKPFCYRTDLLVENASTSQQPNPNAENKKHGIAKPAGRR